MAYFEIGIYHTKAPCNIGTLWRSAYQLGASGIFTIGRRYKHQSGDTYKTARHIPLRHYPDFEAFQAGRAIDAQLIAIEMDGVPLADFRHPRQAIYLLGAEDYGLPPEILEQCQMAVSLEATRQPSYNVAVAGSIVMYHRCFL